MLSERVDATPCGDDQAVEEFLASSCPFQPQLTDQQQNDENDAVCDEGASHNEVSQTLAGMVSSAEAKRCDASEKELDPSHDWQCLTDNTVCLDHNPPDLSVDALVEVELQVHAHGNLSDQHEHYIRGELGMNVLGELSAFILVAEKVAYNGEEGAGGLNRNVPFRAGYLAKWVSWSNV